MWKGMVEEPGWLFSKGYIEGSCWNESRVVECGAEADDDGMGKAGGFGVEFKGRVVSGGRGVDVSGSCGRDWRGVR